MVRVVCAGAPFNGVTVAGLNPQDAPAGTPEQVKLTSELKPFAGLTAMLMVPVPPYAITRDEGARYREKSGGSAVMSSSTDVLFVTPPLVAWIMGWL